MRMPGFWGSMLLLAPVVALGGDSMDVKLGLWEISTSTDVQGMTIPPKVLDKMSPEQRARLTATMQKHAGASKPHLAHSCVTAEDLKHGAFRAAEDKDERNCKTRITAQTRTLQEATVVCTGEESRTTRMKIEVIDRDHIKGTIENTTENGKTTVQLTGKWVRATCNEADEE